MSALTLLPRPVARRILVLQARGSESSVRAALRDLPALSICESHTVTALAREIRAAAPDLVVADLDCSREGSAELIELLRATHAAAAVFLSTHVEAFEARVASNPRALILDKPLSDRTLRHIVSEKLRPNAPFVAADYIQLACAGQHSVCVTVEGPSQSGEIYVVGGLLWSASLGSVHGVDALRRLAFATDVAVRCDGVNTALPGRNLPTRSWEQQLLDAARDHDESNRGFRAPSALEALEELEVEVEVEFESGFDECPEESPPDAATDGLFARLMERAADALLTKDYATACLAYEEALALHPNDRRAKGNLARLRVLMEG